VATPSTWNLWSTSDFQQIFARSSSAITPSKKSSINTNRKYTTRFPMSLRWSSYIATKSPKGGLKTQNGRFPSKIALRLKKVCYKVSLCENCQRQSCKAFISLTIGAKIIGGGRPVYLKFWIKLTALEQNCRFSISFRSQWLSCEKSSINTKRSPLCAFQWAQDEHRMLSLSPPKGGSKMQSVQNLNNKLR